MSASTKLSTSVKALCFLAKHPEKGKTSLEISEHTGINASKLRKILSLLVKDGLVSSEYGASGGFKLDLSPAKIHLQRIYCAIEDRKAFYLNVAQSNGNSDKSSTKINNFFLDLFADIQVDIEDKMRKITLQHILNKTNSL